ncbi:MAG: sarcosine oxidase [Pseudomonas sp.]|uniref:sarcosine oxidase subunit gamma n=1 Tax=Pseudomonas sp. TaxID=306 RepID=UPI003982D029
MTTHAAQFSERSPLYRLHDDAQLGRFADSCIVTTYGHADERQTAAQCGLLDLSNLARVGFRGAAAAAYLEAHGYELPKAANLAVSQADGGHVLRLSQTEYLLLGSLLDAGARISQDEAAWVPDDSANYLLPRQDSHAWLLLSGQESAAVMAKLCGVDLRPESFPAGSVAQTSAARINVIIANLPQAELPCLHILCDRASAHYLWGALLDAMEEFAGQPVGLDALL